MAMSARSQGQLELRTRFVLHALEQIGIALDQEKTPQPRLVRLVEGQDWVNLRSGTEWRLVCASRSSKSLAMLVKGLTWAERKQRWKGGSVAGPIWLFHRLAGRKVKQRPLVKLATWILANTENYDLRRAVRQHPKVASDLVEPSLGSTPELPIEPTLRPVQEPQTPKIPPGLPLSQRIQNATTARYAQARRDAIAALDDLPLVEQLQRIAEDPQYPPHFFPTRIADAAREDCIAALSLEAREALARNLKGRRRGPWGSFKQRLLTSLGRRWG
jgi:hypothetical protein